jgi:hypothetical protein
MVCFGMFRYVFDMFRYILVYIWFISGYFGIFRCLSMESSLTYTSLIGVVWFEWIDWCWMKYLPMLNEIFTNVEWMSPGVEPMPTNVEWMSTNVEWISTNVEWPVEWNVEWNVEMLGRTIRCWACSWPASAPPPRTSMPTSISADRF